MKHPFLKMTGAAMALLMMTGCFSEKLTEEQREAVKNEVREEVRKEIKAELAKEAELAHQKQVEEVKRALAEREPKCGERKEESKQEEPALKAQMEGKVVPKCGGVGFYTVPDKEDEAMRNAYEKWKVEDVLFVLKEANVGINGALPMTKNDYGMTPMLAKEAEHIFISSLGKDEAGRVYTFEKPESLEATKTYYDELGKSDARLFSWTFVKDNVLVQLNGDVSKEQAKQFEQALKNLKK